MGSASCEVEPDGNTNINNHLKIHRPEFFACPRCNQKFTELALRVHKRLCNKQEDCCCDNCNIATSDVNDVPNSTSNEVSCCLSKTTITNVKDSTLEFCHDTTSSPDFFLIENGNERCLRMGLTKSVSSVELKFDVEEVNDIKRNIVDIDPVTSICAVPNLKTKNGAIIVGHTINAMFPDRRLECVICAQSFPWKLFGFHLLQHVQRHASNSLPCPKCRKIFFQSGALLYHFHEHMTDKPFICKDCGVEFRLKDKLNDHTADCHGYVDTRPYHCYVCMRRFSHSQSVSNHIRLHIKETPFKCNECSRSFTQIGNLQRHLGVHRGDRPHKCQECGRSFADPATLRNHIRIHTGEQPYRCDVCFRGFRQVGNLKRHMARHLQSKPRDLNSSKTHVMPASFYNLCPMNGTSAPILLQPNMGYATVADENMESSSAEQSQDAVSEKSDGTNSNLDNKNAFKLFTQLKGITAPLDFQGEPLVVKGECAIALTQLKQQRKKDTWQLFPCPICGKVYTWQHDLTIHYRTHTGEKPYRCEICDKTFAQSGAVRIHKARHHDERKYETR